MKKSFPLWLTGAILISAVSCQKDVMAPVPSDPVSETSSAANLKLIPLQSGFSRAFDINNSGAIAGSVRNAEGKSFAFMLKNNASWFSSEEVRPNGQPEIRFSINDAGDIVGHKLVAGGIMPVLWKHGQAYDLQPLPGEQYGEVYDINNAGLMVGESLSGNFVNPSSARATIFSVENGPADLGTLGGARAGAAGVNDAGDIVGFAWTATGESHAFLFKNGVMQDLGTLGGTVSNANAINNKGEIVGRALTANGSIRGFLYKNGLMYNLGTLGGASSVAFDINDKGEIVGFSRDGSGQAHAFLYKNGQMYDLGNFGGIDSRAYSINNRGDIVGQYTLADGSVHGFLYRDGQVYPL